MQQEEQEKDISAMMAQLNEFMGEIIAARLAWGAAHGQDYKQHQEYLRLEKARRDWSMCYDALEELGHTPLPDD